ncbi:MAG TPA: cell division protein ZapA [Gemmatimonadaceae bacterium]|jgi:cell division protein ZapA
MSNKRNVVKVMILNEEYNIRSDTSVEQTRAVAEYVDRAIRQVMASGMIVETNKAAILAALQIAGELFESRENSDQLSQSIRTLSEETRELLAIPARTTQ